MPSPEKTAVLYRMVLPDHICPYGWKARHLLRSRGYKVDDRLLTTRAEVDAFKEYYAKWGALIILLKGLTPIPYKLVTITSGFAGYNIWLFILCSIVARGGRFFVVAVLLNRYGDLIRSELEKRLGLWVAIGAVVLALGFVIAFKLV